MTQKELNDWLKELGNEVSEASKKELKEFLKDTKSDSNDFIRVQASLLEKYLTDLVKEDITVKQFKSLVEDQVDIAKVYASMEKVRGKVKIKNFAAELIRIIIGGLIKALL